jgi:hypothetical protein
MVVLVAMLGYRLGRWRQRAACYGRHAVGVIAETDDRQLWIDPAQGAGSDWHDSPTLDLAVADRLCYPPDHPDPRSARFRR